MTSNIETEKGQANLVSIVRSSYEDVYTNVSKAVSLVGGLELGAKSKIIIKVNLCDARTPDTGAVTNPIFLGAVLRYLRENCGNIDVLVVESDGRMVLADLYAKWFGLLPVIQKWHAEWRNLSKECLTSRKIPGLTYKELPVPRLFENSYFITLPKLKTNILTKITCCLKNQRGCNPLLNKQRFHARIDEAIVAENLAAGIPDFCIVDGIVGMGSVWGPSYGIPIHSNLIVAGRDQVAVDCVCSRIMGFNPEKIGHIQLALKHGLGSDDFRVVGEQIADVKQDFKWSRLQAMLFRLAQRLRDREHLRTDTQEPLEEATR
jgi:uncharacterized protein (DUF362 family)